MNRSNYTELCARWRVTPQDIISARVIERENGTTNTISLIRFTANPGNATFEAKVLIIRKNSKFESIRVKRGINRINAYEEQSSCVGTKTDVDKEMKAFCMCRSKVVEPENGFKRR